jgi:formate C-acetyltransferase
MTPISESLRRQAQERGENRNRQLERLLMLRGLRANADEPVRNLRRAKTIAHMLDHYPVVIDREDLLVGKLSTQRLAPEEARELADGGDELAEEGRGLRYGNGGTGGHRTVDFETLLELGVTGVLQQVYDRRKAADSDDRQGAETGQFCDACELTLSALLRFADRYRETLCRMAADNPHFRETAALLERVPRHPPRTFREALQAVWFVQLALVFDDISCTGHPDRYLWPFYERDLREGRLTRADALRLIEDLYLRSNEVFGDWPETIMVGGTDQDGEAVVNDLTYLSIEAIETVGLVNPNVALCYREDTPQDLLELCLDKSAKGFSHPALYNDAVITAGLIEAGLSVTDARYYQNSTCVEITPVGTSNVQVVQAVVSPVKALERLLNGGEEMLPDARARADRLACPDIPLSSLGSFSQFLDAYKDTLHRMVEQIMRVAVEGEERRARRGSCPLVSCFVRDCIERGRDVAAGGARYNYCGANISGFSTAVDSLCAIRDAVYVRQLVTLPELAQALRDNFASAAPLRQALLNTCPKYGNDDSAADEMAEQLYEFIRQEISPYRTSLGGTFHLGCFSGWGGRLDGKRVSASVSDGACAAASADGRLAGMPLSENIGPAPGADVAGLTALVNSVTKLDHRYGLGGLSVNWRLNPGMLRSKASRDKVLDLIREFMRKGGFEVQLNVIDSRTLRQAKAEPERFRNLAVRIAGYSEYFCNVGEAQQDAIIARTEYEECGKS